MVISQTCWTAQMLERWLAGLVCLPEPGPRSGTDIKAWISNINDCLRCDYSPIPNFNDVLSKPPVQQSIGNYILLLYVVVITYPFTNLTLVWVVIVRWDWATYHRHFTCLHIKCRHTLVKIPRQQQLLVRSFVKFWSSMHVRTSKIKTVTRPEHNANIECKDVINLPT